MEDRGPDSHRPGVRAGRRRRKKKKRPSYDGYGGAEEDADDDEDDGSDDGVVRIRETSSRCVSQVYAMV